MSKSEVKPREFWIRWQEHWPSNLSSVITNVMTKDQGYAEDIHVIEYSYVRELEDRLDETLNKYSALVDKYDALIDEKYSLKTQNKRLRTESFGLC